MQPTRDLTEIVKVEDQRLVFGWASIAKTADGKTLIDRQDDYIDDVDHFEKSAYDYVLNCRDGGVMHLRKGVATVIESMVFTPEKIAKLGLPPGSLPTGWWLGFRVTDDQVWDLVKRGKFSGFSVHGRGRRERTPVDMAKFTDIGKGQPDASDVHVEGTEDTPSARAKKLRRKRIMMALGDSSSSLD